MKPQLWGSYLRLWLFVIGVLFYFCHFDTMIKIKVFKLKILVILTIIKLTKDKCICFWGKATR